MLFDFIKFYGPAGRRWYRLFVPNEKKQRRYAIKTDTVQIYEE